MMWYVLCYLLITECSWRQYWPAISWIPSRGQSGINCIYAFFIQLPPTVLDLQFSSYCLWLHHLMVVMANSLVFQDICRDILEPRGVKIGGYREEIFDQVPDEEFEEVRCQIWWGEFLVFSLLMQIFWVNYLLMTFPAILSPKIQCDAPMDICSARPVYLPGLWLALTMPTDVQYVAHADSTQRMNLSPTNSTTMQ